MYEVKVVECTKVILWRVGNATRLVLPWNATHAPLRPQTMLEFCVIGTMLSRSVVLCCQPASGLLSYGCTPVAVYRGWFNPTKK